MIKKKTQAETFTFAIVEKQCKCRACGGTNIVKNGFRRSKQCWRCKICGFQGVENPCKKVIETYERARIQKALAERISLHGIGRIFDVGMSWLMWFATAVCKSAPEHLCVRFEEPPISTDIIFEIDEMWTFVGEKENKVWVWMVMERQTRQIIAFEVGDRSAATCEKLWKQLEKIGVKGVLYTDLWRAYAQVLPEEQHVPIDGRGETNHVERFNGTLRARNPRVVRRTYSFSKKLENLVNHLRFFFGQYNLALRG